jgi:spermidine synthase
MLLSLGAVPAAAERVVHVERGDGLPLVVTEDDSRRCLRFGEQPGALAQSCQWLAHPDHLAFEYTRTMVAVLLLWQPTPRSALLIGVGGGSILRALAQVRPAMQVDAVDIDAGVLRIAGEYFGLVAGPRLRLHVADGRDFVAAARARGATYDAVLLDAFDAEGIPPALFSAAFLRDVRGLLTPGGVFLANTFAASATQAREAAVAQDAFGRLHEVRVGAGGGNRLFVAAAQPSALPDAAQLMAALPAQADALARLGIDTASVQRLEFRRPARAGQPVRQARP